MEKPAEKVLEKSEATLPSRIRELNDRFRTTFLGGKVMMTPGIQALGNDALISVIAKVQNFNDFTKSNDPYAHHDFGAFRHDGERIFWKIDYYDPKLTFASDDPSNPAKTVRVLTIMLASEY